MVLLFTFPVQIVHPAVTKRRMTSQTLLNCLPHLGQNCWFLFDLGRRLRMTEERRTAKLHTCHCVACEYAHPEMHLVKTRLFLSDLFLCTSGIYGRRNKRQGVSTYFVHAWLHVLHATFSTNPIVPPPPQLGQAIARSTTTLSSTTNVPLPSQSWQGTSPRPEQT